ncbi:Sir2 family NAD-dependent protein deacetylase [Kocuria atrinae]|uniref:Sir2 family NAD-dependent protein deacetylase n=1 Tax=Kocuria atrinae TaxID=592377 RepID=UPI0003640BAB|nr:Sir2 family NAD-dependent protein deacetylase [Kocuria atrinae]
MPVRVIRAGYGAPNDQALFPDPHALDAAAGLPAAASALKGRQLVVLTGAGVSTDSGIPDYRGPEAKPRTPMTYQEFMGSERMRRHYWARNQFGWHFVANAEPSGAHIALAELERRGIVRGIITQNIDRLHQKAGSIDVLDLHGTHQRVICTRCGTRIPRHIVSDRLDALNPGFYDDVATRHDIEYAPDADATIEHTEHFEIYDCPVCQEGILKPDVVFFGENAPAERVRYAKLLVDRAQALLVAGTSLTVNSGKRYVRRAVTNGMPVVIVNHGVTGSDHLATVKVDAFVGDFLQSLTEELLHDLD